jgi:hypothetical protein
MFLASFESENKSSMFLRYWMGGGSSGTSNLAPVNGIIKPGQLGGSQNTIDPNKGLYSQVGAMGNVLRNSFGTGAALSQQNQATAQSQQTASNLQNQLNARIAQGNLAHPLSQITGQGNSTQPIAPLNTRASVDTPAQLQSGTTQTQNQNGGGSAPSTVPPPTQTPAPAPTPAPDQNSAPTFPGIVGTLAQTASQPNDVYNKATQAEADIAKQLEAQKAYQAGQETSNAGMPIPLNFMAGRNTAIQGENIAQENALAGQLQAEATIAGQGTQQQGTQQQGLAQAGGLAAPQPGQGPGTQAYNPLTGQYSGLAGNSAGGGNGGGLYGVGGLLNQQNLGAQANTLTAVQNQARNDTQLLQQTFQQYPYINPTSIKIANGLLQLGANQIGDPGYQNFQNQINDIISRYSQILTPANGNVTDMKTQIAQSLINAQASQGSIQTVLDSLDQQASKTIEGLNTGGATSNANGQSNTNSQYDW